MILSNIRDSHTIFYANWGCHEQEVSENSGSETKKAGGGDSQASDSQVSDSELLKVAHKIYMRTLAMGQAGFNSMDAAEIKS